MKFVLLMAWRDFRAKPSRFFLYILAIAIGVGALTSIESFRRSLESEIHGQGRNLLGADLMLRSIRPFTGEQKALVDRWPGRKALLVSYRTMLLVPETSETRLVEVQAMEPYFPFYGTLASDPPEASRRFQESGEVLCDEVLMLQLNLQPGAPVQLGGQPLRVAGALKQTPGEAPARALVAPRVILPMTRLDQKRFEQPGMMARFEWYLAGPEGKPDDRGLEMLARSAREVGLDVETVAGRREQLLGNADRIGRYLGLMGFTALVIGCLGVSGAVHFFVESKRRSVAQLRCIGASLPQSAGSFLVQLVAMGVSGATLGLVAGALLGLVFPKWLAPFIPVPVDDLWRADAALMSWLIGLTFALLSGLIPLAQLRHIGPLQSLRVDLTASRWRWDWPGMWMLVLLAGALMWFAVLQLDSWKMAGLYVGGVALVIGILGFAGLVIRRLSRKLIRPAWSYPLRLAAGGLYRPQNQTILLVVSLGMGMFLLNTVDILEQHLRADVEPGDKSRPNIAMIDIQTDQRDALRQLVESYHPASTFMEPMITMRLAAIHGVTIDRLEQQPDNRRPNWALKREFRTTYREQLKTEMEEVIAGQWIGRAASGEAVIPVSLEEGIAEALQVTVGDRLTFDIHGEPFEVALANIRKVDWKSMQPNFFVIFPVGVIDDAPQTLLMFIQLDDLATRAAFQADVARRFSNITMIDISMVMNTVSSILGQLATAVRSIAWMTLSAGFLVLLAILRIGRGNRLREAILLRTMGASRGMIIRVQIWEFILVASVAIVSGLLLSWVAGAFIVMWGLEMTYAPPWASALPYSIFILAATTWLGWLNGRAATRISPNQAWRSLSLTGS